MKSVTIGFIYGKMSPIAIKLARAAVNYLEVKKIWEC